MQTFVRAAGSAAALFTLAVTASFAGPSFASEAETAPTISYAAHAAAAVETAEVATDSLEHPGQLAHDIDFSNPIAAHAVANADPVPSPLDEASTAERAAPESGARRDGRSLAELVSEYSSSEAPDEQADCLARAVYFESNGEPLPGQLAVAEVIINRAQSGRFPSTLCGVVRQRGQFSFVRGGHIPAPPRNAGWRRAVGIARVAMQDLADSSASRALFFHARRVSPGWRNLTRVATVGNHVFYR